MTKIRTLAIALTLSIGLLAALTACSTNAATTTTTNATIIDVRTPGEYAAGHLEGAVNIDVSAATFKSQISALAPTGTYALYCHSGNRAAQAKAIMDAAGFTQVTNLGSIDAASQTTGKAIIH